MPDLRGRCGDEAVCEAKAEGAAVLVGGKAPGTTAVIFDFKNPVTGVSGSWSVLVTFVEERPVPLEVGKPLANAALLRGVPGSAVNLMCFSGAVPPVEEKELDGGDIVRGFAEIRRCGPALELSPGRRYTPFGAGDAVGEAPVGVCLHHSMRDEQLVSLSVFRTAPGQPRALLEHRGPSDEVCAPRGEEPVRSGAGGDADRAVDVEAVAARREAKQGHEHRRHDAADALDRLKETILGAPGGARLDALGERAVRRAARGWGVPFCLPHLGDWHPIVTFVLSPPRGGTSSSCKGESHEAQDQDSCRHRWTPGQPRIATRTPTPSCLDRTRQLTGVV